MKPAPEPSVDQDRGEAFDIHACATTPVIDERRPVVVAISGDQPNLLSFAAELAQMFDAPLRVMHTQSFQMSTVELFASREAGTILYKAAARILDAARDTLVAYPSIEVEYTMRYEPTVFAIETESQDAAMVVLGADDLRRLEPLARPDVARRSALHSACPVVVVPPDMRTPSLEEAVVALDIDNVVDEALNFALEVADRTGARVRVIAVVSPDMDTDRRTGCEERLQGIVARSRTAFPRVAIRAQLISGDPSDVLAGEARRARLIVVGHPNQPHRAPLFSKRVAASLLRTTRCAVVVVPVAHES
ncbi:universal stress protein [Aeromicrobium sp.]|uniref:universal stress protein n=1 Tax=Aeromicrobium sp. TaxID=1871063 RepID=UPI002FC97ABB